MNPLYYLTTDSYHSADAEAFAFECGLPLAVIEPRDIPRLEPGAALILDWDYLPDDIRLSMVTSIAVSLVAVHGYNLDDGLSSFLPQRGVVYSRHLDLAFFRGLAGIDKAA